jgi:hypothetical protein
MHSHIQGPHSRHQCYQIQSWWSLGRFGRWGQHSESEHIALSWNFPTTGISYEKNEAYLTSLFQLDSELTIDFLFSYMSLECQPTSWLSLPFASRNGTEPQDADVHIAVCLKFVQISTFLSTPTVGSSWQQWGVMAASCCCSQWRW